MADGHTALLASSTGARMSGYSSGYYRHESDGVHAAFGPCGADSLRLRERIEGGILMPSEPKNITRLLQQSSGGDRQAFDELVPIVYDQLHRMAARCFSAERCAPPPC